jgi:SAM-dependent methyltransferase
MRPRFLVTEQDWDCVRSAMASFYLQRPSGYGERREESNLDQHARFAAQYIKRGARVLNMGPGTWREACALAAQGFDVDGCDVWSEEYLAEQLHQMPSTCVRLARYDGRKLPYFDEMFDAVCSFAVFEHLLDVEATLLELDRVLRSNGRNIIVAPNWAGPHAPIHALCNLLMNRGRYWQYETLQDALTGLIRSLFWPVQVWASPGARFLYVHPRMQSGDICFERSDDDAVHLSCPVSYRKWFERHDYRLLKYNRGEGKSRAARLFNSIFPAWATTVAIVAEKP